MSTKNDSNEKNRIVVWSGSRGEPKAVGQQVAIDPDHPKPPGINPKATPTSSGKKADNNP